MQISKNSPEIWFEKSINLKISIFVSFSSVFIGEMILNYFLIKQNRWKSTVLLLLNKTQQASCAWRAIRISQILLLMNRLKNSVSWWGSDKVLPLTLSSPGRHILLLSWKLLGWEEWPLPLLAPVWPGTCWGMVLVRGHSQGSRFSHKLLVPQSSHLYREAQSSPRCAGWQQANSPLTSCSHAPCPLHE